MLASEEFVILPELPDTRRLLASSLLLTALGPFRAEPRPTALPNRTLQVADVPQLQGRLASYDRLCGFGLRNRVPATWIHVMHFPLQMALLSAGDAPFSLAGIIHVTNSMTLHRPVLSTELLTLTSRYGTATEHRRGVLFEMIGQAFVGDELVWEGTSSYLVRGGRLDGMQPIPDDEGLPVDFPEVATDARWRLAPGLGRRYAAVSGDYNPIHLSTATARLFGFPKAIIHGMWTHARVLAALEPRVPSGYRMDVRFTKPIMLPSSVRFGSLATDDGWQAVVRNRGGDKSYLTAQVTRL